VGASDKSDNGVNATMFVAGVMLSRVRPAMGKDVFQFLPTPIYLLPGPALTAVQNRVAGWGQAKILAALGAGKTAGLTDKWPGNDFAHGVLPRSATRGRCDTCGIAPQWAQFLRARQFEIRCRRKW